MTHETKRPSFEERCPVCVAVLLVVGFMAIYGLIEIAGALIHG